VQETTIDISDKPSPHSLMNKIVRVLWQIVYLLLFRPTPRPCHSWRRFLLRLFGANLGKNTKVAASATVWAPWNLTMEDNSTLADRVDCYCVAPIRIGAHSTISQYSFLCGASHDFEHPNMLLTIAPITIGRQVWVCADVFVAAGVEIGEGAVVGARSSVFKNLPPWKVCSGNPAEPRRDRVVRTQEKNDA